MNLVEFITKKKKRAPYQGRVLGIDPGNETGNCLFVNGELVESWQTPTAPGDVIDWNEVHHMVLDKKPDVIVCEDYILYQHKMKEQSFSKIPTLRIIGAIQYIAAQNDIPVYFQIAAQHKKFVTDEKLKMWGLWQRGMRHSRDSIRAVCYWLIFNENS